jgi:acyl-CoA synthetase (NDP forming)
MSVPQLVDEAGSIGCRAMVICSSGFAESGPGGQQLQVQLRAAGAAAGIRILGPNSQGVVFGPSGLAATFTAGLGQLAPRGAAYVGQSGALGGCLLDHARERGLNISAWVSTGNQVDLDVIEVSSALLAEDQVKALLLYVETAPDGQTYEALAESAAQLGKPLIALRSGTSAAGARANESHTGAALSLDAPFELASRRHGVVLTREPREMLLTAQAASALPAVAGDRVAVITTSGGAGAIASDCCTRAGLRVPQFSAPLRARLEDRLPAFGAAGNPVDVTAQVLADTSGLAALCTAVAESGEADALLLIVSMVTGGQARQLAADLAEAGRRLTTPLLCVWLAGEQHTGQARETFARSGLPAFLSIGEAVDVLRRLHDAAAPPGRPASVALAPEVCRAIAGIGEPVLIEGNSLGLLDALGIARPAAALVRTPEGAERAVRKIGGSVVMKLQSPAILHKTEVRGVRHDVPTAEAGRVCRELLDIGRTLAPDDLLGVLVQAAAPPGLEMIVGIVSSGHGFPPVLSIGIGGTNTDLYDDRAQALLPVDRNCALDLIGSLRAGKVLRGFRGQPAADVDALAEVIVRLSDAATALGGRLAELEINPLRVFTDGHGVQALDFLLRLQPDEPGASGDLEATP